MTQKIRFAAGGEFDLIGVFAGPEEMRGHRRDVATITVTGVDYAAAAAKFTEGAGWYIVDVPDDPTQPRQEYDWTAYTFAGAITDNRDGTLVVKMGKADTREQELETRNRTLSAENSRLTTQAAEQAAVIDILTGEETNA